MSVPSAVRVMVPSPSKGPRTATGMTSIRASAVMTTGYVYGDGTNDPGVATLGFDTLLVGLDYTKGDETSVQIQGQYWDDVNSVWRTFLVIQTPSVAGLSEMTDSTLQMTAANFASGIVYKEFEISCKGKPAIRFGVKVTGGSSPGTLAMWAAGGLQAVAAA